MDNLTIITKLDSHTLQHTGHPTNHNLGGFFKWEQSNLFVYIQIGFHRHTQVIKGEN